MYEKLSTFSFLLQRRVCDPLPLPLPLRWKFTSVLFPYDLLRSIQINVRRRSAKNYVHQQNSQKKIEKNRSRSFSLNSNFRSPTLSFGVFTTWHEISSSINNTSIHRQFHRNWRFFTGIFLCLQNALEQKRKWVKQKLPRGASPENNLSTSFARMQDVPPTTVCMWTHAYVSGNRKRIIYSRSGLLDLDRRGTFPPPPPCFSSFTLTHSL